MQTAAKNNLIFTELSSLNELAGVPPAIQEHGRFYQHVLPVLLKRAYTKQSFADLGNRLVALAHQAYTLRRMETVEEISQVLMHLPISQEYRNIGRLYHSYLLRRTGRIAEAHHLLEQIIDRVPVWFRGTAMMSLAGLTLASGDCKSALMLYVEASRSASHDDGRDWFIIAHTQKIIAVLKGIDGNHRGAVADLESMLPFIRTVSLAHPTLYYDYLNSLAVEFGEVGRIEEGRNICKIVLASPLASAYPECRETYNELQLRGYHTPRSFVPFLRKVSNGPKVPKAKNNVVPLPVAESNASLDSAPKPSGQPARVLDLTAWKDKMVNEPNDTPDDNKPIEELDEREKILRIFQLVSSPDRTEGELHDILASIEKIISAEKGENKK